MTPSSSAPIQTIRWHAFPDLKALQKALLEALKEAAEQAIRTHGQFHLVLAGGNTPRAVYCECQHLLTDWSAWHIYFGDERCLPTDHPDRNSAMANEAWLNHVPIPKAQIHIIPAESGAASAAIRYAEELRGVNDFDLVLLGLGEDGHTASLFPGHDWGKAHGAPTALPVFDAPKPPAERVSLSAERLSRSRKIIFLVSGAGKSAALAAWRNDHDIPARAITPHNGVDVFCEENLLAL